MATASYSLGSSSYFTLSEIFITTSRPVRNTYGDGKGTQGNGVDPSVSTTGGTLGGSVGSKPQTDSQKANELEDLIRQADEHRTNNPGVDEHWTQEAKKRAQDIMAELAGKLATTVVDWSSIPGLKLMALIGSVFAQLSLVPDASAPTIEGKLPTYGFKDGVFGPLFPEPTEGANEDGSDDGEGE